MKRIISVVISTLLIVALLSACGGKNEDKTTTSAAQERSLKYSYDAAYAGTDQSAVKAFESICDAVLHYQASVRMNTGLLEDALQLFYTSFPLSSLVKDIQNSEDGSGITILYQKQEAEHKKAVSDFQQKIFAIYDECMKGTTNKTLYAIRAYHYVAEHIQESDDISVRVLDTVINGKGTSFSYANLFEYLLQQADIPAYHVLGSDLSGKGWGLSCAELDGELYYFDMMSEHYANEGAQLVFFGMTSEDVKNEGLLDLQFTNRQKATDASDMRFDMCRRCSEWEIDGANLVIHTKGDEHIQIAL